MTCVTSRTNARHSAGPLQNESYLLVALDQMPGLKLPDAIPAQPTAASPLSSPGATISLEVRAIACRQRCLRNSSLEELRLARCPQRVGGCPVGGSLGDLGAWEQEGVRCPEL